MSTKTVPTVYQLSKTVKNRQTAKNDHWCTNRHMSTQSLSNTQSRVISAWNDLPVGLTVDSSYVGLQSKVLIESANLIFSKYSFTCYGSPTSCCYWLSCARAYARRQGSRLAVGIMFLYLSVRPVRIVRSFIPWTREHDKHEAHLSQTDRAPLRVIYLNILQFT